MVDMLGDEVENELQREGTATRTVMSSSTSLTKVASGPTGPTGGDSDKDDKGLGEGRSGRPKEDNDTVVVGFAFMAKKIDSMAKIVAVGRRDAVEFLPLDFSNPAGSHDERHGRPLDVILHKLSDDIMLRDTQSGDSKRLAWIEKYLAQHPKTAIVDPIDSVSKVINRVTTLELLTEAYRKHGAAGGMPRPPRYLVLAKETWVVESEQGAGGGRVWAGSVSGKDDALKFPVICKPVNACGSRGSHTMIVVLDETGMKDVPAPIVVQEYCNHGALLFKVCVIGDDVRVYSRPSLPDLPQGLLGSFTFDSQKPYPSLAEVEEVSVSAARARREQQPHQDIRSSHGGKHTDAGVTKPRKFGKWPRCYNRPPSSSEKRCYEYSEDVSSNGVNCAQSTRGEASNEFEESPTRTSAEGVLETGDVQEDLLISRGGKTTLANSSDIDRDVKEASHSTPADPPDDNPTTRKEECTQDLAPADIRLVSTLLRAECRFNQILDVGRPAADGIATSEPGIEQEMSPSLPSGTAPFHTSVHGHGLDCSSPPPAHQSGSLGGVSPTTPAAEEARAEVPLPPSAAPGGTIPLDVARVAARRMRETFGLSVFGFDLIIDSASGDTMVIDVNFFPSFKDLHDFPQVLRRRLKEVAAHAKRVGVRNS